MLSKKSLVLFRVFSKRNSGFRKKTTDIIKLLKHSVLLLTLDRTNSLILSSVIIGYVLNKPSIVFRPEFAFLFLVTFFEVAFATQVIRFVMFVF